MADIEVPSLPRISDALSQAQGLLDEQKGNQLQVNPRSLVPNPLQGLWIVSYESPTGESLDGGGIFVDGDGAHWLSSDPGAPELIGAMFEDEDEDPSDEMEIEALLEEHDDAEMAALIQTFGVGEFGPPNQDFDETVCIMAIPAKDDPVHGIGPEDKHATILYFGDRSKSADPERIEGSKGLFENVLKIAAEEQGPFTAKVTGIEELGDEGAQVWLLDSPELQRLFGEIPEIDSEIHSMYEDADATRYPDYKPHVTIGYEGVPDEAADVREVTFDRISLWWGNEHIDFPLGVSEFDALLSHFAEDKKKSGKGNPGFDPNQPRATDGRWNPGGGGGGGRDDKPSKEIGDGKKVEEDKALPEWKRQANLVKAILATLKDVLGQLSSKQAKALIEQIESNAKAFIKGQQDSHGGGGGGGNGGGKDGGGGKDSGGGSKDGKGGKDSSPGDSPDPGGGGGGPAGVAGIVVGVKKLIEGFGQNMKDKDRKALNDAVKKLEG
jgi:2'-5' RNA ligase